MLTKISHALIAILGVMLFSCSVDSANLRREQSRPVVQPSFAVTELPDMNWDGYIIELRIDDYVLSKFQLDEEFDPKNYSGNSVEMLEGEEVQDVQYRVDGTSQPYWEIVFADGTITSIDLLAGLEAGGNFVDSQGGPSFRFAVLSPAPSATNSPLPTPYTTGTPTPTP